MTQPQPPSLSQVFEDLAEAEKRAVAEKVVELGPEGFIRRGSAKTGGLVDLEPPLDDPDGGRLGD